MIHKVSIQQFLILARQHPVLDVRSPGEYAHAHISGAHSLALFSDEERKQVGTAYKQQSREAAIKIGLDYFGVKMRKMVEEVEALLVARWPLPGAEKSSVDSWPLSGVLFSADQQRTTNNQQPTTNNVVLIHCWRGGMRSAAVAWLLDLYGFKVYQLVGGYKAYRKWIREQFEKQYQFNIIGGYTGSGKTLLLYELAAQNKTVIDLEHLANHKGSAFGTIENRPQPSQEMFENLLGEALYAAQNDQPSTISDQRIFLEDESQRIGNLQIPLPLWYNMRKAPVLFMDIPFEARLNYITEEYGKLKRAYLEDAIVRIQKRLGGLETKNALQFLKDDNLQECFRILLTYYDKWYHKGLYNRENVDALLNKIPCAGVDTAINTHKIITCEIVNA